MVNKCFKKFINMTSLSKNIQDLRERKALVEMGGGGQGDVIGGSDGRSFWAKVGLPNFDGSHVKAHRSALDYIKSSPRSGAKCMKAVRVIDN